MSEESPDWRVPCNPAWTLTNLCEITMFIDRVAFERLTRYEMLHILRTAFRSRAWRGLLSHSYVKCLTERLKVTFQCYEETTVSHIENRFRIVWQQFNTKNFRTTDVPIPFHSHKLSTINECRTFFYPNALYVFWCWNSSARNWSLTLYTSMFYWWEFPG